MKFMLTVAMALLLYFPTVILAADLGGYTFQKISGYDQKAVIKTPQGELVLVGVGDEVGDKTTITQIGENLVMLERPGTLSDEQLMVRLENGRQKIDVMKREPLRRSQSVFSGQ